MGAILNSIEPGELLENNKPADSDDPDDSDNFEAPDDFVVPDDTAPAEIEIDNESEPPS